MVAMVAWWPLFGLQLETPRLVLRPPRDDDFPGLLDAIDAGIHRPEVMPFLQPWTDAEPSLRRRNSVQHWWANRSGWSADDWHLEFAVFLDGCPIGIQEVFATQFPVLREVGTGSWLAAGYQGRGLGREMRVAVLRLAFEDLGARVARSGAFVDNHASIRLSRTLGYRDNGRSRQAPRGEPKDMVNLELTVDEWWSRRGSLPPVAVIGLDEALDMFGLDGPRLSEASQPPPRRPGGDPVLRQGR